MKTYPVAVYYLGERVEYSVEAKNPTRACAEARRRFREERKLEKQMDPMIASILVRRPA